MHSKLCECFADEQVFLEVVDVLLGITSSSTESKRKQAAHRMEGYFIKDDKLWKLGGATPTRAVSHQECITKKEATQLAQEEHAKIHLHRDLIKIQLLDHIYSLLLDVSISKAIQECRRCKNFSPTHIHTLLMPMTQQRPFELLASDYLSMPTRKGGFGKVGLYIDVFVRRLWAFKLKSAVGKNTVDNLCQITQTFKAPDVLMVDGRSHFDCNEV